MNQQARKQYDALHRKIEAIYLGATGDLCEEESMYDLQVNEAKKIMLAISVLVEKMSYEIYQDFSGEFGQIEGDRDIEDLDAVTDFLFEKGVRA